VDGTSANQHRSVSYQALDSNHALASLPQDLLSDSWKPRMLISALHGGHSTKVVQEVLCYLELNKDKVANHLVGRMQSKLPPPFVPIKAETQRTQSLTAVAQLEALFRCLVSGSK
jgi:hypothetical protein